MMFKALDLAISDRNSILCFAYLQEPMLWAPVIYLLIFFWACAFKKEVLARVELDRWMFRFLYRSIPLGDEANCLRWLRVMENVSEHSGCTDW